MRLFVHGKSDRLFWVFFRNGKADVHCWLNADLSTLKKTEDHITGDDFYLNLNTPGTNSKQFY